MRRAETLIIALALGFYAWLLRHFGFSQLVEYVRLVGWGLAATIALEAVARIANAIGYVTPSAQLGGQFVMALMVRRKLAMATGLATVVVAALAEAAGQIGFISGALLTALPFEARLHHLLGPVIGGLAIVLALAAGFFYVQLKHPFSHLWRAAAKLDIPQLANPEVRA